MSCSVPGCDRKYAAKGYCLMHYKRWKRTGDAEGPGRKLRGVPLVDRLDILSDRSAGWVGCWIFTGTIHHSGYGSLVVDGVRRGAHVWAYVVANGEPPEDAPDVLHSCDNPPCINPAHLRSGTDQDNANDKVKRGRLNPLKAEDCPAAVLTNAQVAEIRRTPGVSGATWAEMLGVSRSTISLIRRGQTWQSING